MTIHKVQSVWLKKPLDEGIPTPDLFEIRESHVDEKDLKTGGVLLETLVMSVDPYVRFGMKSSANPELNAKGEVILTGYVAGRVVKSKSTQWKEGDFFAAETKFSTMFILSKQQLLPSTIWKLTGHVTEDNIERGVGVLGMPGATAYAGVVHNLQVKKGDTVFISAASGAVGNLASQIAKIQGAKAVIGSCGGPEKCKVILEKFGYDAAIDYKTIPDENALTEKLKEIAPDGIDKYFENVGGMHFQASLSSLRRDGRICVCGAITSYHSAELESVRVPLVSIIMSEIQIKGLNVMPYLSGTKGNGNWVKTMSKWIRDGKLKNEETVINGIEYWAEAFCSFFTGSNHIGKLAIKM